MRPLLRERRDLFDARLAADLAAIAESHQREWLIDPTILAPQVNAWRFGSIQAGSPSHLGETSATTDEGVAACTAMLLRVSRQRINGQRVADLSGADGSAHAAGRAAGPP
ncbi:hypothetical protein Rai3103_08355 [Raineyella fluvialis]|uniref:Uncharacterized protein n=1 Tax=Raineyella fluvialis TaxID=2662261 RepID=A0A5Q2F9V6_9ACTN|nr:hypothetical protein Rai3103_08355 [Raineyella fluvialis]